MKIVANLDGIFVAETHDNIYIIPDLHGDYQCVVHILVDLCQSCYISGIVDGREELRWIDRNTSTIIFCGDLIHRKRFSTQSGNTNMAGSEVLDDECSDIYILECVMRLQQESEIAGGKVIIVSGNHEMLNIIYPTYEQYTSPLNIEMNRRYFGNMDFVNKYIQNSFAWIVINDVLITHGGLCSDYLTEKGIPAGENIVSYINQQYHHLFYNFDNTQIEKYREHPAYNLFIDYDKSPQSTSNNMFWCREFGYPNENKCGDLHKNLSLLKCTKMIITHCPQFLNKKPLMVNFSCNYGIARLDLGISRAFDYNCDEDGFLQYIENNYLRKVSILKLKNTNGNLSFDESCVVTKKVSCIQYLLLKYGFTKEEWRQNGIDSDWLGWNFIGKCFVKGKGEEKYKKLCNVMSVVGNKARFPSIEQYKKLFGNAI
jgi:hypothetical protein